MKLIAHRGNFAGQNAERENTVEYLEEALAAGYDVEFDVFCYEGKLLLGHDKIVKRTSHLEKMYELGKRYPIQSPIKNEVPSIEWLRDSRKWVHCKDVESFKILSRYADIKCFMQEGDEPESYIRGGYGWINSAASKNSIGLDKPIVHESWVEPTATLKFWPYAIYGYNVSKYKDLGLQDKYWSINTILLDVDGVMTNGKKLYDTKGDCMAKEFCDKDWTAIKRMKSAGLRVIMISSDGWNKEIAFRRNIDWIYANTTGEASKLNELRRMNIDLNKCIYIGDDYYDLELLSHVAQAYCPQDAIPEVKRYSTVIPAKGGENCIAAFYEMIKENLQENFPYER